MQNDYIFWGGWNNFTPFQHSFLHTGVKIITLPLKMLFTCLFIFKSPFPEEFVYPPPRVWWWGGESGGGMKNLKREKIVLDLFLGSRWYNLYIILPLSVMLSFHGLLYLANFSIDVQCFQILLSSCNCHFSLYFILFYMYVWSPNHLNRHKRRLAAKYVLCSM